MNVSEEFRRPVTLGLASLVLIGWILAVSVWALYSSRLGKVQVQLVNARGQIEQVSQELQAERAASGTLAELGGRVAAAKQLLAATVQERAAAAQQVAQLQKQIAEARLQLGANRAEAAKSGRDLDDLRKREDQAKSASAAAEADLGDVKSRLKQGTDQLSALSEALRKAQGEQEARSKALADLAARFDRDSARRDKLASDNDDVQKTLEARRGELTALTEKLSKARSDLEGLDRQRDARAKAMADLDKTFEQAKSRRDGLASDSAAAAKSLEDQRALLVTLGDQVSKVRLELDALRRQLDEARKASVQASPRTSDGGTPPPAVPSANPPKP